MKYLHNFDTVAEYEAVKDTLEMPYIVSIDETAGLQYNTDVIRVPQGSDGSGGGGADLEGEYFLAKPNGRYWKFKLARMERNKYPAIMGPLDTFTNEQIESLGMACTLMSYVGFSGIGDYGGIPSHGTEISYFGCELYQRTAMDMIILEGAHNDYVSLLGAWQEGSVIIQNNAGDNMILNGIVDIMRISMEADGMSDDEILAMASEMLMMEQVTKEEYESWYNW